MLLNSKKPLKCTMLTLKCFLKKTKRDLEVASTRHHLVHLLKYYPRRPCAPSFVKSRILPPLQRHFLLFQQIFFILVCVHAGNPRVPPWVLASGPKRCGGNSSIGEHDIAKIKKNIYIFASNPEKRTKKAQKDMNEME